MNYSDYVDILRSKEDERNALIEDLESQGKTIEQHEYEIAMADFDFQLSQMED
tara:strand:+ start:508 stop:666 length:159 start_codon:yes stop_codon:yes gene_type:complete